jgi:hypothetical protein
MRYLGRSKRLFCFAFPELVVSQRYCRDWRRAVRSPRANRRRPSRWVVRASEGCDQVRHLALVLPSD